MTMTPKNRAFDDAVTAFRNGEILAQIGYEAGRIDTYRVFYIYGMTTGCNSKGFVSETAVMALDDAETDRLALGITGEA